MRFKSFDQFLNESVSTDAPVNEGLLSRLKDHAMKYLHKVGDFFTGIGSTFMNALLFQKNRQLPKGIEVYPSKFDINLAKEYGVTLSAPKFKDLAKGKTNESLDEDFEDENLDEAVISTKYPDVGKVVDVSVKELKSDIKDTVEGSIRQKPLLIWGAPGIGKTAIIDAIAELYFGPNAEENMRLIKFDLQLMQPEDFTLPTVSKKEGKAPRLAKVADRFLPVYSVDDPNGDNEANGPDGKGGILFLDELARCSSKIQGICLTLINERKLGEFKLGSKWRVIAAANRKSDLSDDEVQNFHWSSTLGNRFRQVNYAATLADWTPWASNAKDELGELLVKPEIVTFLKFNEKYFHYLDPEDFSNLAGGSEAWPSPRSWTDASEAIKTRERRYQANGWKDEDGKKISHSEWQEEQEDILAKSVGREAARAFAGYQKLMDKISPSDIEKVWTNGKDAPKWNSLSIDEKHAFISAVVFKKRDAKELTEAEMDSFADWIIANKDSAMAVKCLNLIQDMIPSLWKNDYWKDEVKGKFVDAFPNIFNKTK
jgi:DNA polymerase III delta prime subunit